LGLSRSLALSAPQLTLDIIKEWSMGFTKADTPAKTAALTWIGPWLANLEKFARPSSEDGADHVKGVAEVVRLLISVTVAERWVSVCVQYAVNDSSGPDFAPLSP
jgi:neurofibromin 1